MLGNCPEILHTLTLTIQSNSPTTQLSSGEAGLGGIKDLTSSYKVGQGQAYADTWPSLLVE